MSLRGDARAQLERAWRSEHARIVSALTRILGSLERAEDVVQAAAARALESWPLRGLPANPAAWLTTVARRIALDRIRSDRAGERLRDRLRAEGAVNGSLRVTAGGRAHRDDPYELLERWPDERLKLIFLCCHPSLTPDARRALTLREVCGLSTEQVSRAFLVNERTMAQRLVRAKRRLRESGADLAVPVREDFPSRLDDVLAVIYLLFNEGYLTRSGESLIRPELCDEAIHVARTVNELLPTASVDIRSRAETMGLLSMMLLVHSRRHARRDETGVAILLEDQDRSLWQADEAAEGLSLLDAAVALRHPGPYQIKAAINALHHTATDASDTDWAEIHALYSALLAFEPTSVVRLNRAVCVGMWKGPEAGLRAVAELAGKVELDAYPYYHLARAKFLGETGRSDEAAGALQRARECTANVAERRFIERAEAALMRTSSTGP